MPVSRFIFFISIVSVILYLLNLYIFRRLTSWLGWRFRWYAWLLIIIPSESYILAAWFDSAFMNTLSMVVYRIGSLWFGAGFILLNLILLIDVYHLILFFIPNGRKIAIKPINRFRTALLTGTLITFYSVFNTLGLDIEPIRIDGPGDIRIVQISDLHLGSTSINDLKTAIETTNRLTPDAVVITGDFIDSNRILHKADLSVLKRFEAPVFFASGNHESYIDTQLCHRILEENGITILDGKTTRIGDCRLSGLPDVRGISHLRDELEKLPGSPHDFDILLCHRPFDPEIFAEYNYNLILSGHTHSGQIFPFYFFVRNKFPFIKGLYRADSPMQQDRFGTRLYVSSGAGTWGPRMRLGTRNSITLITISRHKDNAGQPEDSIDQPQTGI